MQGSPRPIEEIIREKRIASQKQLFTCVMCKLILYNAYQTQCGCYMCETCVKLYFKKGSLGALPRKCPNGTPDCLELTENMLWPDAAKRKEISKVALSCPFSSTCPREDLTLSELPNHEITCSHREVECVFCDQKLPHADLETHMRIQCARRFIACSHCHLSFERDYMQYAHLNRNSDRCCNQFTFNCPYECGTTMLDRTTIQKHSETCSHWKWPCPWSSLGCKWKGEKTEMVAHMSSELSAHLKSMREAVVEYSESVDLMAKMLDTIKTVTGSEVEGKFDKIVSEIELLISKARPASQMPSFVSNKSDEFEEVVYKISGLKSKHWPDDTFIWRIASFSDKITSGNAVCSEAFYSGHYLWRLCLARQNTEWGFLVQLLSGEYDEMVQWPFKNSLCIQFLQGRNSPSNISQSIRGSATAQWCVKPQISALTPMPSPLPIHQLGGFAKLPSADKLSPFIKEDSFFVSCKVFLE